MTIDSTAGATRVVVEAEGDIVTARQRGRTLALELGFSPGDATLVATAISELARNILLYARRGEVAIEPVNSNGRSGLKVVASDEGPGILDPERAMQDGFSTSGRLGLGLPGVRRLMDDFLLETEPGRGTTVRVRKWTT